MRTLQWMLFQRLRGASSLPLLHGKGFLVLGLLLIMTPGAQSQDPTSSPEPKPSVDTGQPEPEQKIPIQPPISKSDEVQSVPEPKDQVQPAVPVPKKEEKSSEEPETRTTEVPKEIPADKPTDPSAPKEEPIAPVELPTPMTQKGSTEEKAKLKEELERLTQERGDYSAQISTEAILVERVTVDDVGTRILVLIQTSRPVEAFVFERNDPPSLFIQFMSSPVVTSMPPVQVVGQDPLTEIRYGYASFYDATRTDRMEGVKYPIDYVELRMSRSVFYHVQQEGWVLVIGLDRTSTKVQVPELDFRFDTAQYKGAANLPGNPRKNDFVEIALANSRLLTVAREEAELSKFRVTEARRALLPAVTARVSATRGEEVNPFPNENISGFEATTFKRDEYGVQVTQPLWQSGRLFGAYRQAKLNRLMALENVRKQAQDLAFEVKKAYFTLLKNQAIMRVRQELVAQGENVKDMVRKKFKLDLTSKAEVLNVTAQADQATYQLVSDEQDVILARLVLISLLNQEESLPDPIPGELPYGRLSFNLESIIGWAKDHRPDVRIARLNTELASFNWKSAKADGKFKLDVSGFYGRAGAAFENDVDGLELQEAWNVGLKVSRVFWGNTLRGNFSKENTAPDLGQAFITKSEQKSLEVGLLDMMPGISNTRQAQLTYERSKAELVEASRKAEYEVRETFYNLEKAARQLEAVREDLIFRKKDLEITKEKVKLGLSELSQLMSAEVAYAQAQVTEQEALSAYNVALGEMDRVAGAEVVQNNE